MRNNLIFCVNVDSLIKVYTLANLKIVKVYCLPDSQIIGLTLNFDGKILMAACENKKIIVQNHLRTVKKDEFHTSHMIT